MKKMIYVLLVSSVVLTLGSCKEKTPAEKAKATMEQAAKDAEKAAKKAEKEAKKAVE